MDNNFNDIILNFSKDLIEKVDGLINQLFYLDHMQKIKKVKNQILIY
jgi:hypothetical protein